MKTNTIFNISGPWERNASGFYPLDKGELAKSDFSCSGEHYKLSYDWVKGLPFVERDSHYTLSYDWVRSLADNFAISEDDSKLVSLIEEDKEILLKRSGALRFLYKTEDALDKGRRHGLKNRNWEDSGGKTGSAEGRTYIIRNALNAIRVDEFERESLAVSMMHTNVDFEKTAEIWREFRHSPGLKVLKNFKVAGRCFSLTVSYKGHDKEVRIYIRKRPD